jgi:hypothetical protein
MVHPDDLSGDDLNQGIHSSGHNVHRYRHKRIIGNFDFDANGSRHSLEFHDCHFTEIPDLSQTHLVSCKFINCKLPGLDAENLSCDNSFVLEDCAITGPVMLNDADIHGNLILNNTRFENPNGHTFQADRLHLDGSFSARCIVSHGELRTAGMRVGGNVDFSGAQLVNATGHAFNGSGITVGGNLVCEIAIEKPPLSSSRFSCTGLLYLHSAIINNHFLLRGAVLAPGRDNFSSYAKEDPIYDQLATLILDRARINGSIRADQEFLSSGTLRIKNAFIGDAILLRGANITLPTTDGNAYRALHIGGSEIKNTVDLSHIVLVGQLHMIDVKVGGHILLNSSTIFAPGADAINARRLSIGLNFDCKRAKIKGSIEMPDSKIGSNLNFRGSTISHPGSYLTGVPKPTINIRHAHIQRDLVCDKEVSYPSEPTRDPRPFTITGIFSMRRARVDREINFRGAKFTSTKNQENESKLNADDVLTHDFILSPEPAPQCHITLHGTVCSTFESNEHLWDTAYGIDLTDFHYDQLKSTDPADNGNIAAKRLQQFKKIGFQPSAYDQLATVFRANGNDEQVRLVLFEKQRERYKAASNTATGQLAKPLIRVWSFAQRVMVGYGYRPTYALIWIAGLLLLGSAIFQFGYDQSPPPAAIIGDQYHGDSRNHGFIPVNEQDHPWWNPFLFTADLLVPIIDFGSKSRWLLPPPYQWIASLFIAVGWILASSVTAGITRLVRKD